MKMFVAIALTTAIALLSGCREDTPRMVAGAGTIHQAEVDCSAWFVHADSGTRYELTSLPAEFQHNGLRVKFAVKLRGDLLSTCMAGQIADVVSIKKL